MHFLNFIKKIPSTGFHLNLVAMFLGNAHIFVVAVVENVVVTAVVNYCIIRVALGAKSRGYLMVAFIFLL